MKKIEENGTFLFESPQKIKKNSDTKWSYWLSDKNATYDNKTKCGTVYKAPLTENDRTEIDKFKEEISITISSGSKTSVSRAKQIIKLANEHLADFEKFQSFTHFYILFRFSPEKIITMDELGKIIMELTGLVKEEGLSPMDYFWAAESVKGLGNMLQVTIQAGK